MPIENGTQFGMHLVKIEKTVAIKVTAMMMVILMTVLFLNRLAYNRRKSKKWQCGQTCKLASVAKNTARK